jgi:class 3 adenylate cyclase
LPEPSSSSEPNRRTLLASVLFADIVGYSKTLVAQQIELKSRFNAMINRATEHVTKGDRMILDTGDGAALCFLGDPEDALIAATNLRAAALGTDVSLRLGINLGPVKIVKDVNGRPNLLGDGINDAQRVMSFAAPSQILVSRTYYEVLSRLSQEYSRLFSYVGVHRDKHVREHEVYAVAEGDGTAPAEAPGAAPAATPPAAPPAPAVTVPAAPTSSPPALERAVVETEFVPAPPSVSAAADAPVMHFEPAVLARMETALARSIGPLARLIVRKAAGSATDLAHLYRTAAASVPESKQAEFARDLGELVSRPPAVASQPAPVPGPPATPPAQALPDDVLAKATERLALYIGPVAKVIVKKTAGQATSARDLYERLAQHIDDPKSRERFIAAAR